MGPVVFHRHLPALAALFQREKTLAFGKLLRKISEQLCCYFAVPPLRLKDPGEGNELALAANLLVFLTACDG